MLNKALVLAFFMAMLVSCTPRTESREDPKGRLTDYIGQSFSVKKPEDKAALLGFLTGEAKARLEAWSDDQFKQAFVDSKRELLKLTFAEVKPVSPTETTITYELSYIDQGRGVDAKVTHKKLSQLVKKDGKWYIDSVRNIKEMVEYRNELSLP